jgi:hypothetical protein
MYSIPAQFLIVYFLLQVEKKPDEGIVRRAFILELSAAMNRK